MVSGATGRWEHAAMQPCPLCARLLATAGGAAAAVPALHLPLACALTGHQVGHCLGGGHLGIEGEVKVLSHLAGARQLQGLGGIRLSRSAERPRAVGRAAGEPCTRRRRRCSLCSAASAPCPCCAPRGRDLLRPRCRQASAGGEGERLLSAPSGRAPSRAGGAGGRAAGWPASCRRCALPTIANAGVGERGRARGGR